MTSRNEFNRQLIEEFRATRSLPDGPYAGRQILLLTTIGRRTGQSRITPVMYVREEDRLLVIASNAGATTHPHWYLNLVADPKVEVEVGAETFGAEETTRSEGPGEL